MGKSRRKNKIFGNAGGSEKKDKQRCNRILRKKVREKLHKEDYDAEFPLPNEVFNIWSMAKDGKHYWKSATPRDMLK
jgi:hypothetical protein